MFNTDSYGNIYFPAGVSVGNYPIITTTPTHVLVAGLGGLVSKVSVSQLVSNTAVVNSVFGRQGDIIALPGDYTSDMVKEVGNLYFTNSRSRASISITTTGSTGPATYDPITGVLNIPQYQNELNGVTSFNSRTGAVVLTALDVTTALTYTPIAIETDPIWAAEKSLYYTKVESDSIFALAGHTHSTSEISEGTNLYYTDGRVGAYLIANNYATQSYVSTQIANLVDSAPTTLDTLNELAAALGDDPNFATTVSTSIGTRVPQTRTLTINGTSYDLSADRSWTINSMVYPSAGIAISTGTAWGTSITDNSGNWNTAFGWGNHAVAGYLTTSSAASTYVSLTGSYADPSWITSLAYSKITGVPAFLTSYTETDTLSSVTGRGASTSTDITLNGALTMGTSGTSYVRMGRYPASTTNTGEAWIGRASDRNVGTMTVQLGGNSPSSRNFEVVDYAWSVVLFSANSDGNSYSASSFRAPLFYDSNNTGYYVDPNSTSNLYLANFGDNSSSDQGIGIYYGNNSSGYGRIRFYQGGSNHSTIHSFSNSWNGGNLANSSSGAINITGSTGVTFGDWNNVDMWTDRSGNMQTRGSMRSPIFYDSNNTGYYVDPGAESGVRAAYLNGNLWINPKSESYGEGVAFLMPNQATWGGIRWTRSTTNFTGAWALGYFGNESNDNIGFHSSGANGWRLDHSWNMTSIGSVRSPIFYDSDNTACYVDPANGGFVMNGGTSNRVTYTTNDSGFRVQNAEGNGVSDVRLGAAWGRPGIYSSTYLSLGSDGSYIEFVTNNSQKGYIDSSSNLFAFGSMRSPIFYDSNNTGYYLSPDSTSVLANVQAIKTYQTERFLDVPGSNDGSYRWVRFPMGWFNSGGMSAEIAISRSINDNGNSPYGGCTARFIINSREWHSGQDNMWYFYTEHGSNNAANGLYGYYIYQAGPRDLASGGYWFYMRLLSGVRYRMSVSANMNFNSNQMGGPEYDVADPGGVERITLGTGVIGNNGNYNRVYSQYGFYSSDVRTPIYYDSQDTFYLIDPNTDSRLNRLGLGGVTPDLRLSVSGDAHISSTLYMGGTAGSFNSWGSRVYMSGGDRYVNASRHEWNNVGYGSTWSFIVAGGDSYITNSSRAPIFYDTNDTFYFVDPNSTSRLSTVTAYGEYGSYRNDTQSILRSYNTSAGSPLQFYLDHNFGNVNIGNNRGIVYAGGTYWEFANSARAPIFYDSDDTGYYVDPNTTGTSARLRGNLHVSVGNVTGNGIILADDGDIVDNNDGYAAFRFSYGIYVTNGNRSGTYSSWRHILHSDGNSYSSSSKRAPIFYDYNDTGYYLDPASGSLLNGVIAQSYLTASNCNLAVTGLAGQITLTTNIGTFGGYFRASQHIVIDNTIGGYHVYVLDASGIGVVKFSGAQSWSAHSDARIKTVHSTLENNLSKLDSINPIYYSFNNFVDEKNRIGLIAQEVQEHFPELVDTDPKTDNLTLDYTGLIPVLLGAIKELKTEIETLKQK